MLFRSLERGRRGLGRLEALEDQVGDGAGAALVADEAHHVGGVIGRQAFEHAEPNTPNALGRRAPDRPGADAAGTGPPRRTHAAAGRGSLLPKRGMQPGGELDERKMQDNERK